MTASLLLLGVAVGLLAGLFGIGGGTLMVAGTTGIIYLPAVLLISLASVVFAPVGARLSRQLPAHQLQRGYALLLLILCAAMLWSQFR